MTKISGINTNNNHNKKRIEERANSYKVKANDKLDKIAKNFGLTKDEFCEWTGISPSSFKTGLIIKFPMAPVPKSKGIMALARQYGMTLEEFGKLNNLPKPYKEYKAKNNEKFYVMTKTPKPVKTDKPQKTEEIKDTTTTQTKPIEVKDTITTIIQEVPTPNNAEPTTPQTTTRDASEIAKDIKEAANNIAAISDKEFQALLAEITSDNVEQVIKEYDKISPNESLLEVIVDEIGNDKQARKDAVIGIYDKLAEAQGTSADIKTLFEKELDKEFNSFGPVDTDVLDRIIKRMTATPKEIATEFKDLIHDKWGAVETDSFQELLKFVTPENAIVVIKEYEELNTGESLFGAISSEVSDSKNARKQAILHIYDQLESQFWNGDTTKRTSFKEELDARFNDWGMVDTTKLEEMLDTWISNSSSHIMTAYEKNKKNQKVELTQAEEKIQSTEKLRKDAIRSGIREAFKKFQEYCNNNGIEYNPDLLDTTILEKIPLPNAINGKILPTESELLPPTTIPNGKVVILNAGHGGYSSRTGFYDNGAYGFIKNANGKYEPLLETEKMKDYTIQTAESLRAQGYAVVITYGHLQTFQDSDFLNKLVNNLNNGTKGKYDMKNISFVSLHADSNSKKSGTTVCYDPEFADDTKFAKIMNESLNSDEQVESNTKQRINNKNGLFVLRNTTQIPSILVEVEYINGTKNNNLTSKNFQARFINKLIAGLNEYYNTTT